MDYYGASDKGLKRAVNEDSYCCVVNANNDFLACVCDGIGGAAAGEVASKLAVMHLLRQMISFLRLRAEVLNNAEWGRLALVFFAAMKELLFSTSVIHVFTLYIKILFWQ